MLKVSSSRSPANLNLRLAYPLNPGEQNPTLKWPLSTSICFENTQDNLNLQDGEIDLKQ
jgi:hypothetical protein